MSAGSQSWVEFELVASDVANESREGVSSTGVLGALSASTIPVAL